MSNAAAFANSLGGGGSSAQKPGEGARPVSGGNYAPAAQSVAREFVGSMRGQSMAPVANGYKGAIQTSRQLQGNKSFRPEQKLFSANNPNIIGSRMDMGKMFKTGTYDVGNIHAPIGFRNPMPTSDDAGTTGLGAAKTNDIQVKEFTLEPSGYENKYHSEELMQAHLPEGSFVFQYLPPDTLYREMGIIHTVSTINQIMRSTSTRRNISFRDGEEFARVWRFAGVPEQVERHQGYASASASNVIATVCVRGKRNVKNIFAATGKTAQCGMHLYLLLRKYHSPDVQADMVWADTHSQHNSPFYDYIRDQAEQGVGHRPSEAGRTYWQLTPHMTMNSDPPPPWLYNGPDWSGTFYHVGVVEQDDTPKVDPQKDEARVLATVFPDSSSKSAWQENFEKLHSISINVGDTQ